MHLVKLNRNTNHIYINFSSYTKYTHQSCRRAAFSAFYTLSNKCNNPYIAFNIDLKYILPLTSFCTMSNKINASVPYIVLNIHLQNVCHLPRFVHWVTNASVPYTLFQTLIYKNICHLPRFIHGVTHASVPYIVLNTDLRKHLPFTSFYTLSKNASVPYIV